ncbi:MAG: hypothetical protein Q8P23_03635 [bacterium]|nr:hypothetical protein [bacterium]
MQTRKQKSERNPIPVVINPIALYVDVGLASQEAIRLLAKTGVPMDVMFCTSQQEEIFPTAVYRGWRHKGIESIRNLHGQIEFDSKRKGGGFAVQDPNLPSLIIRWDLLRGNKPLDEITAGDVPCGLDADDVCALNPDGSLMLTRHNHSEVIHGRSHQTDRYPDGCLVHPN